MKRGVMNVSIVAAFLAAFCAWLLYTAPPEGQAMPTAIQPAAGTSGQVSALEKTLINLKNEMTKLRQEQDRLTHQQRATEASLNRALSSGAPTPAADLQEGTDIAGEHAVRFTEERIIATMSELDARLGKEPEDPRWSKQAEMDIVTLLSSDVLEGSQVRSVECRATLCRMEIDHADAEGQNELEDHLPMEPPFDGEMMTRRVDDGGSVPRTLIYLARSGHPLLAETP